MTTPSSTPTPEQGEAPHQQRLFMANSEQYTSLLELLERPAQVNKGIQELFSRRAPWDAPS